MSDPLLALLWLGALGAGVGACVLLHRCGLPSTYARDLLHIGAGSWVLGWPAWERPAWPLAITAAVAVAVLLAPRLPVARPLVGTFTDGDERWGGLVLYTVAYALGTAAAFLHTPAPAALALLSLSLGDGLGGLVGRRFGRLRYRVPGGKTKTLEGSVTVALGAGLAAAIVTSWYQTLPGPDGIPEACAVAAIAEALAPRGTDNLLVPLAVWAWLLLIRWA